MDELKEFLKASDDAGKWLAAALEDPNVCAGFKADIEAFFIAFEPLRRKYLTTED
ncbi:hypothetical protein CSU90_004707 [Salmonella enterica subsp. diarizonae]|uniref:hypothetical protein n=1 Tax=Salmonella enterica TaxID=28901 RepID=UPI001CBFBC09|nr:hypothetical protein [Salmonella enterica]EDU8162091.1 hypothetical protein [Salmonella enterica subsp. diarizonae]EJC4644659.1 hypothetical protein [Salmonella enterica]EKQ9927283.1 hypothetical protein [Salmonella enterica subsp. enterica serovar Panama]